MLYILEEANSAKKLNMYGHISRMKKITCYAYQVLTPLLFPNTCSIMPQTSILSSFILGSASSVNQPFPFHTSVCQMI